MRYNRGLIFILCKLYSNALKYGNIGVHIFWGLLETSNNLRFLFGQAFDNPRQKNIMILPRKRRALSFSKAEPINLKSVEVSNDPQ